ncbi:unnamed protein product [Moneuplotes crassus]|uniref:RCC1-like domain-containing protein n=1 Tax=Euplotes crassus TaxID=5936 RepID=A0AAD1XJS6_EUPCR|nr:unnamed protein product [Moneuplotes crassus]
MDETNYGNEEKYTEVLISGNNHCGQLGVELTHDKSQNCRIKVPRIVTFDVEILQISCGRDHTAFITPQGIYSMGSNHFGKLGIGNPDIEYLSTPHLIKSIQRSDCVQVACGWEHTAAVMKTGEFYIWGSAKYGAIGTENKENAWSPVKFKFRAINSSENHESDYSCFKDTSLKIKSVSCGARFTCAIDKSDKLLVWGCNDYGQLGVGDTLQRPLPELAISNISAVACGINHTLVLSKKGHVYSAGSNSKGELGLCDPSVNFTTTFKKVSKLKDVVKIKAGLHSMAVDINGRCYLWGTPISRDKIEPPTKLHKLFHNKRKDLAPILSMDSGIETSCVINTKGELYYWSNTQNVLSEQSPEIYQMEVDDKQTKFNKIACGHNFMLALGKTLYRKDYDNISMSTNIEKKVSFDLSSLRPKSTTARRKSILKGSNNSNSNILSDEENDPSISIALQKPIQNIQRSSSSQLFSKPNTSRNKFTKLSLQLQGSSNPKTCKNSHKSPLRLSKAAVTDQILSNIKEMLYTPKLPNYTSKSPSQLSLNLPLQIPQETPQKAILKHEIDILKAENSRLLSRNLTQLQESKTAIESQKSWYDTTFEQRYNQKVLENQDFKVKIEHLETENKNLKAQIDILKDKFRLSFRKNKMMDHQLSDNRTQIKDLRDECRYKDNRIKEMERLLQETKQQIFEGDLVVRSMKQEREVNDKRIMEVMSKLEYLQYKVNQQDFSKRGKIQEVQEANFQNLNTYCNHATFDNCKGSNEEISIQVSNHYFNKRNSNSQTELEQYESVEILPKNLSSSLKRATSTKSLDDSKFSNINSNHPNGSNKNADESIKNGKIPREKIKFKINDTHISRQPLSPLDINSVSQNPPVSQNLKDCQKSIKRDKKWEKGIQPYNGLVEYPDHTMNSFAEQLEDTPIPFPNINNDENMFKRRARGDIKTSFGMNPSIASKLSILKKMVTRIEGEPDSTT